MVTKKIHKTFNETAFAGVCFILDIIIGTKKLKISTVIMLHEALYCMHVE